MALVIENGNTIRDMIWEYEMEYEPSQKETKTNEHWLESNQWQPEEQPHINNSRWYTHDINTNSINYQVNYNPINPDDNTSTLQPHSIEYNLNFLID